MADSMDLCLDLETLMAGQKDQSRLMDDSKADSMEQKTSMVRHLAGSLAIASTWGSDSADQKALQRLKDSRTALSLVQR